MKRMYDWQQYGAYLDSKLIFGLSKTPVRASSSTSAPTLSRRESVRVQSPRSACRDFIVVTAYRLCPDSEWMIPNPTKIVLCGYYVRRHMLGKCADTMVFVVQTAILEDRDAWRIILGL